MELSDHEYVVYKGRVFSPETDVNADIPQAGQHFLCYMTHVIPNLKRHMVRLAVYELTKLIAPIMAVLTADTSYEDSMKWLNDVPDNLRLNSQIPRKA